MMAPGRRVSGFIPWPVISRSPSNSLAASSISITSTLAWEPASIRTERMFLQSAAARLLRRSVSATGPLEPRRLPSQVPSNSFLSNAICFFPPDETGNSTLGRVHHVPYRIGRRRSGELEFHSRNGRRIQNVLSGLPTTRSSRRTSKCRPGRSWLILPSLDCGARAGRRLQR